MFMYACILKYEIGIADLIEKFMAIYIYTNDAGEPSFIFGVTCDLVVSFMIITFIRSVIKEGSV